MSATGVQIHHGSYLMPSLAHATVSDAMHPGILSCEPDTTLTDVARLMATHHVHCIVVAGVSHEDPPCGVWGVISDHDLLRAAIKDGEEATARSLAQQSLVTVEATAPLRKATELMLGGGVSHLVVVQPGSERPIGILSTADVAGVLAWGEA
jgi:CBS domain-containing protein